MLNEKEEETEKTGQLSKTQKNRMKKKASLRRKKEAEAEAVKEEEEEEEEEKLAQITERELFEKLAKKKDIALYTAKGEELRKHLNLYREYLKHSMYSLDATIATTKKIIREGEQNPEIIKS